MKIQPAADRHLVERNKAEPSGYSYFRLLFQSVWLYRVVRVGLATSFLASGLIKIADPGSFAITVKAFGILPRGFVSPVTFGIPVLEVIIGLALVLDMRGALLSFSGLLLLFTGVLGYGIWLGLDIDCGCYGPEDPEGKVFHSLRSSLYRDMGMLAAVFYLYLWRRFTSWGPTSDWNRIRNHFTHKKELEQCTW